MSLLPGGMGYIGHLTKEALIDSQEKLIPMPPMIKAYTQQYVCGNPALFPDHFHLKV